MEVLQYQNEEFGGGDENLVARRSRHYSNGGGAEEDNNIEDMSKNSVYLDQSAGMWKCRHCIWTYQNGNPLVPHIHHHKHFNFSCRDALQEERSHEEKRPQVENLNEKVQEIDIQKLLTVISGKSVEIQTEETTTLPVSTKLAGEEAEEDGVVSSPRSIKNKNKNENENQNLKIDIIDESDDEILELEFERAVEKMHTHEYNMYCPNCSNRITKVILRKRKREKRTKSEDLLGCLSCFSIFIPKGNILNPLKIFGTRNRSGESQISQQQKPSPAPGSATDGSLIINIPPDKLGEPTQGRRHPTKPLGEIQEGQDLIDGAAVQFPPEERPVPTEHYTQGENILDASTPLIAKRSQSSHSLEILKSIVYGGLMELVASLSIVSSAAASHATTLNTVALGLANLLGGLLVLFHNVKDLRYEDSEEAEGEKESRYIKLLGRKENFSVHIVFVLLSYVVFGLVPPIVFGFTFRETDDQDLKLVAVASASVLCILVLSIAKVFTSGQHTCMAYSKTVVYYVTGAATASGIAYAAGHLLERFMNNLGWFDAKPVEQLLIPGNKTWASF